MNEQKFEKKLMPPTLEDDTFMEALDSFKDKAIHNSRSMSHKEALKKAFSESFPNIDICQE